MVGRVRRSSEEAAEVEAVFCGPPSVERRLGRCFRGAEAWLELDGAGETAVWHGILGTLKLLKSAMEFPTLPPIVRHPWEATWWVDLLQRLGQAS